MTCSRTECTTWYVCSMQYGVWSIRLYIDMEYPITQYHMLLSNTNHLLYPSTHPSTHIPLYPHNPLSFCPNTPLGAAGGSAEVCAQALRHIQRGQQAQAVSGSSPGGGPSSALPGRGAPLLLSISVSASVSVFCISHTLSNCASLPPLSCSLALLSLSLTLSLTHPLYIYPSLLLTNPLSPPPPSP
jgi:hypothetical protein